MSDEVKNRVGDLLGEATEDVRESAYRMWRALKRIKAANDASGCDVVYFSKKMATTLTCIESYLDRLEKMSGRKFR